MPARTDAPPRWRLDAVALTALAVAAALAAGLATHPPLTGLDPVVGFQAAVVGPVADAVGVAAAILVAGWVAVVALYAARRGVGRLVARALGWAVLTACAATSADYAARWLPAASVYGPGGSVGAYLRFALDDHLRGAQPAAVAVVALVGLTLAADNLVRAAARGVWHVVRAAGVALVRGNRLVEAVSNRVLSAVARVRRALAPKPKPVPVPDADPVPIHTHVTPELRLVPADDTPIDIPIDRAEPLPAEVPPLDPVPYELPPLSLLADPEPFPVEDHESKLRDRAALLEKTFTDFGLSVKVVGIHAGPVVTQYEVALETGLRLSKVTTLADDLALNLKVSAVRVVAPLPGRNTVGIEVPNDHRQTVRLKELILATQAKAAKFKLPIFLGKDVEGRPLAYDLAAMPHLLIAGRTGTGKSVCLNAVILSLLYTRDPEHVRLIMIDPKMVELSEYGKVPHLMHPVVTKPEKAEAILGWAVDKMEERYEWLRRARVRNIATYNELPWEEMVRRIDPVSEDERQAIPRSLPYVVIIVDEVGDLIMQLKKEVESHIIRLAQKSRAAGIHVILATQKPTVDVITGLIKSNMPARICFQVATRADSMVVLDEKGADKLLGQGDLLFLQPSSSTIVRAQGAYVDDREIEKTVAHLECDEPNYDTELLNVKAASTGGGGGVGEKLRERDPQYEQAVEIVIREQRGSTSLLQRTLGIGYGKASRLIDFMHDDGIVGGFNGSNARDVLVTPDEWDQRKQAAG